MKPIQEETIERLNALFGERVNLEDLRFKDYGKELEETFRYMFLYLTEKQLGYEMANYYWSYVPKERKERKRNGFKIHIPFDGDSEEELIGALALLKDINDFDINSKIANVELPDGQNGKDIVIYDDNFLWMQKISEESKQFLLSSSKKKVKGEFNLKTREGVSRIFVRYCNYSDAWVYDFYEGRLYGAERGQKPLPTFMEEGDMPILEDIFEGEIKFNEIGITKDKGENELIRLVKDYVDGIRKKDKEYIKQFPFIPCDILHEFVVSYK